MAHKKLAFLLEQLAKEDWFSVLLEMCLLPANSREST